LDDLDEIVAEFLVESIESLDRLDRDLLALEREPGSREVLASIFRTVHTIKGTCGFLGFGRLERVAHAAESLLAGLRDGSRSMTPEIAEVLLRTGDALRAMLDRIGASGAESEDAHDDLVRDLSRLRAGSAEQPAATAVPAAPAATRSERRGSLADTTIRVDVGLLDRLMTLVGELVLARNHLVQLADGSPDPVLASASQGVDRITAELQDGVMKTRLQPIRTAWAAFPRVVRDLAVALGKQARLETDGEDTELDRSIIEAIKDPLAHLVRNAIDHGIESPQERTAAGKPEEGVVLVRAYHEGGQVTIEVTDDGRGIDTTAIRTKAVEHGVIPADQASRLSERQVIDLLFIPGFSTADHVTTLSGRGVGMDVVRTNIERVGGSIDVTGERGRGTTLKIRIPLTLAIVPALIVTCDGQRFAIPQANVVELVAVGADDLATVHDATVYRLRDRLVPVVSLADEFGSADGARRTGYLVVVRADDRHFGMLVDGLRDSVEIVVKPLGRHLGGLDVFAGATILGDGCVAAIVDVVGLAHRAGITDADLGHRDVGSAAAVPSADTSCLLVFSDPSGARMAVPLDAIDRLEAFPQTSVERSGADDVVRYGDVILPLARLDELLVDRRREPRYRSEEMPDDLQVLVHRDGETLLGVVVGRIIDVVDGPLELQPATRAGVRGTMIVDGRVTEILDLPALLEGRNAHRGTTLGASAGAAS
jgi:two-component system, chemotaxis family, sensor kinase CheA